MNLKLNFESILVHEIPDSLTRKSTRRRSA
jgi:hypothetical protein